MANQVLSYRPIRAQDFGGKLPRYPVKGYTALMDGLPVGIGGLLFKDTDAVLFATAFPPLRKHPLALYKCACKLMAWIKELSLPVVAIADIDIPRSEETLEWFGFEHTGTSEYGEVYEWMPERALT